MHATLTLLLALPRLEPSSLDTLEALESLERAIDDAQALIVARHDKPKLATLKAALDADADAVLEALGRLAPEHGGAAGGTGLVAHAGQPADLERREACGQEGGVCRLTQKVKECGAVFKEAALRKECDPESAYTPHPEKLSERPEGSTAEHNEHALAMLIVDTADGAECRSGSDSYLFTLGCCECLTNPGTNCHIACAKENRVVQLTKTEGLKVYGCNPTGEINKATVLYEKSLEHIKRNYQRHQAGRRQWTRDQIRAYNNYMTITMRKNTVLVGDNVEVYVMCRGVSASATRGTWPDNPQLVHGSATRNLGTVGPRVRLPRFSLHICISTRRRYHHARPNTPAPLAAGVRAAVRRRRGV